MGRDCGGQFLARMGWDGIEADNFKEGWDGMGLRRVILRRDGMGL